MSGTQQVETETNPAGEAPTTGAALVEDDEKIALKDKVSELEARLKMVSAAYQQKQAEIESTKERLSRNAELKEEIRRGEVVATLFEPVENLHRSIEASRDLPEDTLKGLKMIHSEFLGALRKLGLSEVAGVDTAFNPSIHEAIATMPVESEEKDGKVVAVFAAGYQIGTRLIRPAKVVIGSYTPPAGEG